MESDILFNIKLIESESPLFPTFRFSLCSDRRGTTQCRPPVSQEVGRPDAVQTDGAVRRLERPEDVDRGRMPPPEPEGEPPKPATQTAPSASRARRAGGGAVRHRRQDGEAGTWTCPDCRRVISDCPTARDQHINGTYHRASLLWNEGFHKDFGQCQQEVLRRLDGKPRNASARSSCGLRPGAVKLAPEATQVRVARTEERQV